MPDLLNYIRRLFTFKPKSRAHVVVKGRIYEGSYHVYAEQAARDYGLQGWMKVRDGLSASAFLEIEVEGPDADVKSYIMDLRRGNRDSHVDLVTVQWKEIGRPPYSGFTRLL